MKSRSAASSLLMVTLAVFGALPGAPKAMTREQYLDALKIADQKVMREKAITRGGSGDALSSSALSRLFGRYYQAGDTWEVAAWVLEQPIMNKVSRPEGQRPSVRKAGIFHYEVTAVKNGPEPEITLLIRQIDRHGIAIVDPRIETLTLKMNDRLQESEKSYRVAGRSAPVPVSTQGLRSGLTELEFFPLDAPEIATALTTPAKALPDLPEAVAALAGSVGWSPDLSKSQWLEQDDFFGRSVQMLWQFGDPWPAYLKTSNGVAILIRSSTGARAP